MDKKFIFFLVVTFLIVTTAAILIWLAKGNQLDLNNKTIEKTGIVSIISNPQGAAIFLDGHLINATSANNYNISNLKPGEYRVKIVKDGYMNWEKKVEVKPELVTPLEVTLFPAVPELRPLTFTGTVNPKLSPDGTKVVYAIKDNDKSGLWTLDVADKAFSFSRDPKQIIKDTKTLSFSDSNFEWAPDSKNVLSTLQEEGKKEEAFTRNFLLNTDQLNNEHLSDITPTIQNIKKGWVDDKELKNKEQFNHVDNAGKTLAEKAEITWSPDETKFIAINKEKRIIYDTKVKKSFPLPEAIHYVWYPDSKHVILVKQSTISISEADGTNEMVIYNGNFDQNVVFPWLPNGDKLVIAATFNTTISKYPNLYTINLKP